MIVIALVGYTRKRLISLCFLQFDTKGGGRESDWGNCFGLDCHVEIQLPHKMFPFSVCLSDHKGEVREEFTSFPRILFLMHQWFANSSQLALLFISHYDSSATIAPCGEPSCSHDTSLLISPTTSTSSSSSNSTFCSSTTSISPCRTQRFKASVLQALR